MLTETQWRRAPERAVLVQAWLVGTVLEQESASHRGSGIMENKISNKLSLEKSFF